MAYGMNLEDKQSISYKLSEKLNAPVYNRAYPGGGLAQALYILDSNELKNSLNNSSPKYILYFYQPDHIRRIFTRTTPSDKEYPAIFYKEKNKKLVRKYSLLQYSYSYSFFQDWYYFDNNYGMHIFKELTYINKSSLALGFFDGLHLGHKVVINNAVNIAKINDIQSCIITFAEHPSAFLSENKPEMLLTTDEKLKILEKSGGDNIFLLDFESISSIKAPRLYKKHSR